MSETEGSDRVCRARRAAVAVVAALLPAVTGCTGDDPARPAADQPRPVALRVVSVAGADALDAGRRSEVEAAVGDVLSQYVVEGFLGEYPRSGFVRSFEAFTGRAARMAVADLDVLTAAGLEDVAQVRASRLSAHLSLFVVGGEARGATAHVRFRFRAEGDDGRVRALSRVGRLLLVEQRDEWLVYGYDLVADDGEPVGASTS